MPTSFGEISEILQKELYPSLLIGGACAVLGPVMYGVRSDMSLPLPIVNVRLPANLVVAAGVASSNFVGAVAEDFILKNVDSQTGMASRPILNGLASYAALSYGVTDLISFESAFALGSASTVAGQYGATTLQLGM